MDKESLFSFIPGVSIDLPGFSLPLSLLQKAGTWAAGMSGAVVMVDDFVHLRIRISNHPVLARLEPETVSAAGYARRTTT